MGDEIQQGPEDQGKDQRTFEVSHLKCREMQAPIAACLVEEFAKVIGQAKALQTVTDAVQADAMMAGKLMAEKYGGNSMSILDRVVREIWAEDDAMTIQVLEETQRSLSFDVTRCRYAEIYEDANMKELGYCLSCCRDEPFTKGFNARMKLLRTQTIMEGADHCDFRFSHKKD